MTSTIALAAAPLGTGSSSGGCHSFLENCKPPHVHNPPALDRTVNLVQPDHHHPAQDTVYLPPYTQPSPVLEQVADNSPPSPGSSYTPASPTQARALRTPALSISTPVSIPQRARKPNTLLNPDTWDLGMLVADTPTLSTDQAELRIMPHGSEGSIN